MSANQQIFDTAYAGLKAQGFQPASSVDKCWYRYDGLKCAIGHCIPDNRYTRKMDQGQFEGVRRNPLVQAVLNDLFPNFDMDFAVQLQNTHDNVDQDLMEEEMRKLAAKWGLQVPG